MQARKEPSRSTWNLRELKAAALPPAGKPGGAPPGGEENYPRDEEPVTGLSTQPNRGELEAALPEGVSSGSAGDMPPSLLLRRPGAKPGSRTLHSTRPRATPASAWEPTSGAEVVGGAEEPGARGPGPATPGAFRAPQAARGTSRTTWARRGDNRRALSRYNPPARAFFPVTRPVLGAGLAATHARP